jgi:hypothetical protein
LENINFSPAIVLKFGLVWVEAILLQHAMCRKVVSPMQYSHRILLEVAELGYSMELYQRPTLWRQVNIPLSSILLGSKYDLYVILVRNSFQLNQ